MATEARISVVEGGAWFDAPNVFFGYLGRKPAQGLSQELWPLDLLHIFYSNHQLFNLDVHHPTALNILLDISQ